MRDSCKKGGGGGLGATSLVESEVDFVSGVGHFGHDVENRFGSVFEDGLNFRPLHGEEVEQSLGHEGDQALDDGDGGVVFEVRIGVGRFGDRGRGVDDFDGENGSFISHYICLKLGHARDHAGWGPLQEEQEGSFAGHRFGGWLSGHLGQMALLVHSA
jgi:hypothetical protein